MSQQDQLKQACQYIINAMIQNKSIGGQNMIAQDRQSDINQAESIMINLEQQSESFGLFISDPSNHKHWIGMILHHLNQNRLSTSSKQLINCLLERNEDPSRQFFSAEQKTSLHDIRLREIVFYQQIPKFALLLISFQQINQDDVIFIARNFYRQIVYLSINSCYEKKYDILLKFVSQFQSPFLFIFDLIDLQSFLNTDFTNQQFSTLAQKMHLAYFKIKLPNFSHSFHKTGTIDYEEKINTLFSQKYNKQNSLCLTEVQKNKIRKSLQEYHKVIIQEETSMLQTINLKPITVIKEILKINFLRKIPDRLKNQRDLIKFQDFIRAQILIYQEMQSILDSLKQKHEKHSLGTISSCLHCLSQGKKNSEASQICYACSIIKKTPISLCDQCFQPYHTKKGLLFSFFDKNSPQSNVLNPQNFILHRSQSDEMIGKLMLFEQKSNLNLDISKKEKTKPKQFFEQKDPQLSKQQKQKIQKLQDSASKLIELMGGLKNPQLFYKPKHYQASTEKQFQRELKNQNQFMKIIDKTLKREVQTFQNEVFIKIQSTNELKKKSKQKQKFNADDQKQKGGNRSEKMDIELPGSEKEEKQKSFEKKCSSELREI